MSSLVLWSAEDDNTTCEFIYENGGWTLIMTEGPFSGWPAILLNKNDLKSLYEVLKREFER